MASRLFSAMQLTDNRLILFSRSLTSEAVKFLMDCRSGIQPAISAEVLQVA